MAKSHEIHTSEIRSFLGCRRRWNWAYRERIVPEISARPLQFGIAFHIAMETFYNPHFWSSTIPEDKTRRAINAFIGECERQRNEFLKSTGQTKLLEADGDDYTARIDLGIGMLEWYGKQIHPEHDKWFKPVMVEVPFQVPIKNPETGEELRCYAPLVNPPVPESDLLVELFEEGLRTCGQVHQHGAVVTFDGRIDAIMQDLVNGGYLLWDHKSAAQIRKDDRLLHLDPQVNGYTWAAAVELDLDIRGFLYVEYRKDFPKPPEPLSRPYKGRRFSTNKSSPTDYENFTRTVQKFDPDGVAAGRYDEFIAWLQTPEAPVFHKRFAILKTRKNLKSVGKQIYDIARDMINPDLLVYPNAGTYSCSGCAYYTPCLSMFLGEDHEHSLRSTPFKQV
jgi:hypothetical protein